MAVRPKEDTMQTASGPIRITIEVTQAGPGGPSEVTVGEAVAASWPTIRRSPEAAEPDAAAAPTLPECACPDDCPRDHANE
jgi:hypothetical protein